MFCLMFGCVHGARRSADAVQLLPRRWCRRCNGHRREALGGFIRALLMRSVLRPAIAAFQRDVLQAVARLTGCYVCVSALLHL